MRFSALRYGGAPKLPLQGLFRLGIQIVTSNVLQAELKSILLRKTDWPFENLDLALNRIAATSELIDPTVTILEAVRDPDDNRVLECAVAGRADAIIAGDKNLIDLGSYENIPILTGRQFLDDYVN